MRLVIAGGTGFIGSALCTRLLEAGYFLSVLTRGPAPVTISRSKKLQTWDAASSGPLETALEGADGAPWCKAGLRYRYPPLSAGKTTSNTPAAPDL